MVGEEGRTPKRPVPCGWATWCRFGMELNRQPTPSWAHPHPFPMPSPHPSLSFPRVLVNARCFFHQPLPDIGTASDRGGDFSWV